MTIIIEKVGKNILSILINRPEKRNALNLKTIKSLLGALEQFEADDQTKVAIIGGVGGNFCSGYDLNDVIDRTNGMPKMTNIENSLLPLEEKLSNRKLTVAAIDGYAAGVGYELALKCDFRIAERDSRLGFMNRRFGIPIMNGGTVILPQLIGQARANDLIATGKAQLAPESVEYGLINYIADIGCAHGRALNFARSLTKFENQSLLLDLKGFSNQKNPRDESKIREQLEIERNRALDFLRQCGPRDCAVKFLDGQLCRHGNYDLGNSSKAEANMTL